MSPRWLACAALFASGVARAASLDLDGIENVEQLSLAELLERPIVVASRYEQRPADSPLLVSTVDAEQIEQLGYRSVADALASVRGVYLTNDRNYTYLGVRGFSIPGEYNTRIVLGINGHRINDPVYGEASPGTDLGLPMIAIDHVELLRGGAWSLYGQNALLGAIQVITASGAARPGLTLRAASSASAETHGDPAGRSAVAPRAQDVAASYGAVVRGVDVFAAAEYSFDPGLSALAIPDLAGSDERCVGSDLREQACDGVVHARDGEEIGGAYLALRTDRLAIHAMASRRRKEVPTAPFGTLIGSTSETLDSRIYVDATYRYRDTHVDVDARAAADAYDFKSSYPFDQPREGYTALPASIVVTDYTSRATWLTGELRGRYRRAHYGRYLSDLELAAGVEASLQRGTQRNVDVFPEGPVTYGDQTNTARLAAATAHATARAFDHLVGFVAVRGDYTSLVGGISVDPQLGLVLDLDDLGRLRGALSRGYRAPNLYESFYAQLAQINQPQLHGEHSETAEVSFEHYLGTHSRAQAIVYRQRINDLIELTNTGDVLQFTNAGTSIAYGAELELEARWDELRLRANYAYTHARDSADQPRANAPRSVATVTMMLPLPLLRGAVLALETHYLGARRTLTGSEIAPAFSSSAALTLRNIGGGLDLAIGARNVFDARTPDPGTNGHREAAIPQDPRTVWVGVTGKLPGM